MCNKFSIEFIINPEDVLPYPLYKTALEISLVDGSPSPEQSRRNYRGLNLHQNQKIYMTSPYPVAIRKALEKFRHIMEHHAEPCTLPATHSCMNYNKKCWYNESFNYLTIRRVWVQEDIWLTFFELMKKYSVFGTTNGVFMQIVLEKIGFVPMHAQIVNNECESFDHRSIEDS